MRSTLRLLPVTAFVALACAFGGLARAEEPKVPGMPEKTGKKIDNPTYASWAKFKVGTWVRRTSSSTYGENVNKQKISEKLVELTAEKAVIEMVMTVDAGGQSMDMPATKVEHLKQMDEYKPAEVPEEEKPKVTNGEEQLKVGDKTYACKTIETTSKIAGSAFTSKVWTCKDVPGELVKMEHKGETGGMAMTTTSIVEAWGEK